MKLRKGTLLFLLLTCLAYTTLAQTNYTLKYEDVTINNDRFITACSYNFAAHTEGTNLTIPKSVKPKDGAESETIIIKGIVDNTSGIFQDKNLVSVKFAGDSEVTTIGTAAFSSNQKITELTLPASLTTIGASAFQSNQIATLSLPKGLTTIGHSAFYDNQITTLTIPNDSQLKSIGDIAFYKNDIATLDLPTTLTTIANRAFAYNSITKLTLLEGSQLASIGASAFQNNQITTLTIPNDSQLKSIGKEAFQNNQITTLTIPNDSQLKSIGKEAFVGNEDDGGNKITTLALPPSLETIGDSAFYNNSLTTVTFDDDPNKSRIKSIGINAFSGNTGTGTDTGLTGITLPKHAGGDVKYKDSNNQEYYPNDDNNKTFTNFDRSLEAVIPTHTLTADDVTVENGIITKCHCTFVSNKIIIPVQIDGKPITGIAGKSWLDGVFQDKNLVAVAFEQGSQITSIGNYAFASNQITTLSLPTALTTIGKLAFYENKITTLTFPDNSQLTTIGVSAFQNNQIATLTTLPTTLTTIGAQAFGNNPSLSSFILPSVTIEGFRTYWQDGNSVDLETNLTIPQAHFVKSFKRISIQQFSLTTLVEGQQGGTITPVLNDGVVYDIDTKVELTANPQDRWRFDKWVISDEEDKTDNPTTITLNQDKTVTAHFVQLVTLTTEVAEQQGGTIAPLIDPNGKVYDIETEVELTATPNEGWRFDKWEISDEEDKTDNPTTITLNQDKTATAHFVEAVTLTVKVNNEEGGSIEPSDDHFVIDKADAPSTQALTAKPNDGWRFDKWVIGSDEITNNPTSINLDQDKTVTAHFVEIVTLTVKVNNEEGGSIEPSDDRFVIDKADAPSTQALTATPNDGWRFDKWVIGSEERTDKTTTITLNQDKTVTAHFVQLVTLTTAVAEQQGGTIAPLIDPNGKVYDINTKVELTATPNDGWRFDKWVISDEEDKTDKTTTITLDKNKSVTAHFVEAVTLTVKVNNEEGGSIEPSDDRFVIDKADPPSTQELTATPNEGWRFDKWVIGSEDITDNPTTITLDQDKTATAHFVEIVTLTVEVNNEEGGSIEPSDDHFVIDKADAPSTQELTATPNDGWRFDKWVIGSEDITDNPATITLDQDKTVTAHFVKEEEEEAITSILTEVVSANPYPNPVTSQITLKAKDGDLIQLLSQKGKQQYSAQHTGNEVHTIDVSTLPIGVYLVRITDTEGKTTTKRILKK